MKKGILVALVGSTLLAGAAQAATLTLADLIANNGTITDGDKLFSNFAYSSTGSAPAASDIDVLPYTNSAGDYGIQLLNSWAANGTGSGDSQITYTVTVTDPTRKIKDATAVSTGTAIGGSAFWDVSEHLTAGGLSIGQLTTVDAVGGVTQLSDHITFAPVSSIVVRKDIGFAANGGLVDLSIIDQNFSQTAVPEPSTWAMMLLGFAGLGFVGFRKAKSNARISVL
jgi:hypothetical protein